MKMKIAFLLVILALLLASCGGGTDGGDIKTIKTEAHVHFKSGAVGICDYVTYEPGFVTCHWGDQLKTSNPAADVQQVEIVPVK